MIFYPGFSMIVFIIYILIVHSQIAFVFADDSSVGVVNKNDCNDRIIKCLASDKGITPVCGTDGITYSSCQVLSKQCNGATIFVDYTGPCKEISPCLLAQRRYPALLKPRCNRDGTFSSIQCYLPLGCCWCVTPEGHQIPNTLTHYEKPNCPLSRFPLFSAMSPFVKCQPHTRRQRSSACSPKNRLEFVEIIRTISEIEFGQSGLEDPQNSTLRFVSWKFDSLDLDRDGFLSEKESDLLLTMVEEIMLTKNCARSFAKECDLNVDSRFSLNEWYTCLVNDRVMSKPATPLLLNDNDVNAPTDCLSKRQNAISYEQRTVQQQLFTPECRADGRYDDVQCHTGVCWCVDPNNGLSIPNTAVKGTRPNCGKNIAGMKGRIKGCSQRKQKELINEMMALFKNKSHGANVNCLRKLEGQIEVAYTAQVQVAATIFCLIDRNNNDVLQRGREWKAIRMIVPSNRCAKKFPRFCDVDEDFGINFDEWLGCLDVKMTNGKAPGIEFNPLFFLHSE